MAMPEFDTRRRQQLIAADHTTKQVPISLRRLSLDGQTAHDDVERFLLLGTLRSQGLAVWRQLIPIGSAAAGSLTLGAIRGIAAGSVDGG